MKNLMIENDPVSIRWMSYHTALKNFLEDTSGIPNLPKNEDDKNGKNIKVVYAKSSSAFAKYAVPLINGLAQYPIINFYLSSEEVVDEVSGNPFQVYKFYERNEDNYNRISFTRPLIKKLTYTCNIFTTKMSDCDYILTLLECNCNKYKPYICEVNGRNAQFFLDNVTPGDALDYEGKKFIRAQFEITVPRALIFPAEIETDVGIITKIVTELCGDENETVIIEGKEDEIQGNK